MILNAILFQRQDFYMSAFHNMWCEVQSRPHESEMSYRSYSFFFFFGDLCRLLCGVMSGPWDPAGVTGTCHASFLHALYLCLTRGLLDVLFRDSKLTMLLSESLGNINCQTTMIAHISDSPTNYMETLTIVQLASRIYRTRKKKTKVLHLFFKFLNMQSI